MVDAAEKTVTDAEATLLFVDDESNILMSLKRLFRPHGYRILTANGGQEALNIMENQVVDLVVSDMRMPEMDGATFLARAAEKWPDTVRILLTGFADVASTVAAINEGKIYKYVSKPWDDNDILVTVRLALEQKFLRQEKARLEKLTKEQNAQLKELNEHLEEKVADRTKDLKRAMDLVQKAHADLKKGFSDSIKVFASLIEMHEQSTTGNSRQIADLARRIATATGMSESDTQQVVFAGLLRNIGKFGINPAVADKPFNQLDTAEITEVKTLPLRSEALLLALAPIREAVRYIRNYRERYDGRGYPDALQGEDIPSGARVLAIANDFYALQAGRIVDKAMSEQEARRFIKEDDGTRYDPAMVAAFLEITADAQGATTAGERMIKSGGLKPGMRLARDLTTRDGMLVLARGHQLDAPLIERIGKIEQALDWDFTIYIVP